MNPLHYEIQRWSTGEWAVYDQTDNADELLHVAADALTLAFWLEGYFSKLSENGG